MDLPKIVGKSFARVRGHDATAAITDRRPADVETQDLWDPFRLYSSTGAS